MPARDGFRRGPRLAVWSVTCFAAAAGATTGCCYPENAGFEFYGRMIRRVVELATFAADPHTLICGPRIFQVWARRP